MKITIQGNLIDTKADSQLHVVLSGARGPQGPAGEAGASEWGDIGGTLSDQEDLQAVLDAKVDENAAITGATKTKITYDSKGLVTAGADAGIADVSGLQTALDAKVPYTGATQDINLGEFGAQVGNLEFDTTPTNAPTGAGSVVWNDTDGTLNLVLKGGQVISKIGETQHIRAYNNTGTAIARGKVVYVSGAQGQRLTVALADADTEILSKDTIGFTAESIADGAEGFVMIAGVINSMNTQGMADGATVFLSQNAGGYTTTAPADPAHLVILGFIVNGGSAGAGSIYVKVDNGYELEELHNVIDAAKVTPVAADALLLRDSADNDLWKRLTWTNALAGVKSHMDTFKSVANGYASLDGSGKVPASELPSYVDDVIEAANFAALPVTGETGKIYVTLDNNKCYRWSGSVYVEVSAGGGIDTLTTTGTSGAATLVGSTLNIPQYQSVLTNPVTGTGASGQVSYWSGTNTQTGSNNLFWDAANGRLGYQTTSPVYLADFLQTSTQALAINNINAAVGRSFFFGYDTGTIRRGFQIGVRNTGAGFIQNIDGGSGYEFQIQPFGGGLAIIGNTTIGNTSPLAARFAVRGSGTTSATTALLVQNSTPSELFKVQDDGLVLVGNGSFRVTQGSFTMNFGNSVGGISANSDYGLRIDSGRLFSITDLGPTRTFYTFRHSTGVETSGDISLLNTSYSFLPTSGTASYNYLRIASTINQTGGANGITRGLYVNPTLTSAADWRSIETSNNTGYAAYFAGSADLFLGNGTDIQIGTTTGTKIGTATNQKLSFFNATPVVQRQTTDAAATLVGGGGTALTDTDTFDGYTISQIARALRDLGLLA